MIIPTTTKNAETKKCDTAILNSTAMAMCGVTLQIYMRRSNSVGGV